MNQLTTRQNSQVASADDYYAMLAAETETYRGGGGGMLFLKFNGNDGYYSYGADDIDLPVGTQVAFDPTTLKRGFICWVGGQVKEEIMYSLAEGQPPAKHLLNDYGPYAQGDGWQEQKSVEFKMIDGENLSLLFQANNKSKMNAVEALLKQFAREYKQNPGLVPIVQLDENEFEAKPKDGGRKVRKHAPKLHIVGWLSEEELLAGAEGAPEDYEAGAAVADEPQYEDDQPADDAVAEEAVVEEVAPEPAPTPAPRGGRREPPATAAQPRQASRAAPAPAAAAAAPAPARAAPARPAAPAPAQAAAAPAAAAPRGRRF